MIRSALVLAAFVASVAAATTFPAAAASPIALDLAGRGAFVHVPANAPPTGRALVVVLHGGLGNARRIAMREAESGLNMDAVADRAGFVVAYLDGTPVTRRLGPRFLGWNAGACCGEPAANRVDDVAYVTAAVDALVTRYGVDRAKVFGIGHSNGAMMVQRIACETPLLAAVVAIAGPLETGASLCPAGAGRRVLAIHGADDRNVPVAGGVGTKGLSRVAFRAEAMSRDVFVASGATYDLQIVPDADHALDRIDARILGREGTTIAEKAARFFFAP